MMYAQATHPETTADTRWQAVLARDATADGRFYYAVRTTGVYCRPSCPARRPRREHVAFFYTPEAAEEAGFRACRRCAPRAVRPDQQVVARVQALLEANDPPPVLAALGRAVGLSPSHLQRVFRRATGLSPRQYAAARRAERLKAALRDGSSVTNATYDAGYGSSRALYDAAPAALGMPPRVYRDGGRGERIAYGIADSPVGRVLVAATERGVCAVHFGDDAVVLEALRAEFPRATLVPDTRAVAAPTRAVLDHLAGQAAPADLVLDGRGTAFQQRVWAALRAIPMGQTRSYGEIAAAIGAPGAARAVARACATNPVALLVPCHRVVQAGGQPGGYRWGAARKRALLERERALAAAPASESA